MDLVELHMASNVTQILMAIVHAMFQDYFKHCKLLIQIELLRFSSCTSLQSSTVALHMTQTSSCASSKFLAVSGFVAQMTEVKSSQVSSTCKIIAACSVFNPKVGTE